MKKKKIIYLAHNHETKQDVKDSDIIGYNLLYFGTTPLLPKLKRNVLSNKNVEEITQALSQGIKSGKVLNEVYYSGENFKLYYDWKIIENDEERFKTTITYGNNRTRSILYWFNNREETPKDIEDNTELNETDIEHIAQCLEEGMCAGEIISGRGFSKELDDDFELLGWWKKY